MAATVVARPWRVEELPLGRSGYEHVTGNSSTLEGASSGNSSTLTPAESGAGGNSSSVGAFASGAIYRITSAATGRAYIGSTTRKTSQRWLEHLHYLRSGAHHCKHLQRVFDKHGEKDLSFEVVALVYERSDVLLVEQQQMDAWAGKLMNGIPVSDSIYAAHAANRGRVQGADERARRSGAACRSIAEGRAIRGPWSDERKAAHSIALTGRSMPKVSDATKAKLREAALRRYGATK